MRNTDLTSKDVAKLCGPAQLMEQEWAPCRYNCPVHADVRGYIEEIARGRFREAVDIIRENLAFAAVCGRICHHPCEANCRRTDVDEPVAIRELKRFVAETQGVEGTTVRKSVVRNRGKVAIIGSGPAGMAAALDLARLGYRPTVFEKFPTAGGIPATAIPSYRMPREALRADIEWIRAHGVELTTGVEVGKDKTIGDILNEGYKAVLIAVGLAKSRSLPLPGADHKRVYPVLEFLQAIAFSRIPEIGSDVLVIGGGNVAVDAARSALRIGAKRVRMMCLEDEKEMPAWEWEQREAREEGITFIHRRGPTAVLVKDDNIVGVKTRKVTCVFDENKRFNPQYDDSDVSELECDTVIMAIGQMADMGFVHGSGLKLQPSGRLDFDPGTQQTSIPNVFVCGEIATPPGSAVEACASGRRAASAIHMYLSGKPIRIDDSLPPYIEKIDPKVAEKVYKVGRAKVPTEAPESRKGGFTEMDHTLSEEFAMLEARRCMSCGGGAEVLADKCAACLTCARVCPFDIPAVGDVARIGSSLCQACGLCAAECPANAIILRSRSLDKLAKETDEVLAGRKGHVIAYVCGQHASAADWRGQSGRVSGVEEIYVPSMAGVSVLDMLHAFEKGADAVLVVACREDTDRYPGVTRRIRERVKKARTLLEETGTPGNRLQLLELA
jgi:NADPH-dependent glutamate synthase beta subunit-like oxidoreductase/coenzyme F420-reducing hydrogenase delta subunit/Pyruvate/2-oxoacid:ferredoxin oxidoreductase delta subunit